MSNGDEFSVFGESPDEAPSESTEASDPEASGDDTSSESQSDKRTVLFLSENAVRRLKALSSMMGYSGTSDMVEDCLHLDDDVPITTIQRKLEQMRDAL